MGKKGELVFRDLWAGRSSVSCPILRGWSTWLGYSDHPQSGQPGQGQDSSPWQEAAASSQGGERSWKLGCKDGTA